MRKNKIESNALTTNTHPNDEQHTVINSFARCPPSGGHICCRPVRVPRHAVGRAEAAQLPLAWHSAGATALFRYHAAGTDPVPVLRRRGDARLENAAIYSSRLYDLLPGNVLYSRL